MSNRVGRRTLLSLAWVAGAFGGGGALGSLSWPARGVSVPVLLAWAVLTLTGIVGIVWQSRVRAARRWSAALEAYADREIARARSGKAARLRSQVPLPSAG